MQPQLPSADFVTLESPGPGQIRARGWAYDIDANRSASRCESADPPPPRRHRLVPADSASRHGICRLHRRCQQTSRPASLGSNPDRCKSRQPRSLRLGRRHRSVPSPLQLPGLPTSGGSLGSRGLASKFSLLQQVFYARHSAAEAV